ncbi:hypothetical protein [Nocardia sp. NPDC004260]
MMREIPTAIGYLRRDIRGASQQWDQANIRRLAHRLGYELIKTVTFTDTPDIVVHRLIDIVRDLDIDAVICHAPAHLGGDIPVELMQVADVITLNPHNTYSRWSDGLIDTDIDRPLGATVETRPPPRIELYPTTRRPTNQPTS